MGVIGSFIDHTVLRDTPLSGVRWAFEWDSEAYVARSAETGLIMAYLTKEMAYGTIYTSESLLLNWIWRVSAACIDAPEGSEPNLVVLDQK